MEETLHYLIMANHFIFQKRLFSMIKDTELSLGQPKILDYLREHNGSIQKDISAACHIEQASLTSVLNGMEKKGLIVRKKRDGDRRSLYVFLTEKGSEFAERIEAEFDNIEKSAMEGFSDKEKETLITLLSRMYGNIHNNE
ncbi:MAG: MarR family transcriptional regulator [Ruminococcaceae bacterium]|nr:MarR family transcriptional regulator [Oscillospiraceae bacterium]